MTDEVRGHVFPKWGPRGPFRVYSWLQATVTGIGIVIASGLFVAGLFGPALAMLGLLAALLLRDATGLPAWHRVGLGLRFLIRGWLGRRSWTAAGDDDVPPMLAGVEVLAHDLPQGLMGVITDRGRYLAAMRVSPVRDPWLMSLADRDVTVDDWARIVTSLPAETVDRLQVLTVSRGGGGAELVNDAASAGGPGLEVVKEIAEFLAGHVNHTDTVLVLRLSHRTSQNTFNRGGIEAIGGLLYSTLQHLGSQFPAENLQAEILSPGECGQLCASVLGIDELGRVENVDESWGTVRVGEAMHRVLWMWQWPQRPMSAGFLAPMLAGRDNRVVSMVLAPADPEPHQRSLDWAYRRAEMALATAKGSKHRKEAEVDALDRQLRELNEGHVPVQALITVSVTANDPDELEELTGAVRSAAIAGSCKFIVAGGTQAKALGILLPLCRGLDGSLDR